MNTKKIIKVSAMAIVLLLVAMMAYKITSKRQQKEEIENRLSSLPQIELKTIANDVFNYSSITNKAILFIYIDTSCSFCIQQVEQIARIKADLTQFEIIFVSEEDTSTLASFEQQNILFKEPNIHLTHDYTSTFTHQFDIGTTPHLLVYNKEGKLMHNHKGFLIAEKLIALVNSTTHD